MTITISPVVKTRTLSCSAGEAFRAFTEDIGRWWPKATHAINDDVVDIVLETEVGGSIHEVGPDGTTTTWGRILEVDAPNLLRFSWHLQRPEPTIVEVRFRDLDNGCELTLVHSGWEAWGEVGQARRDDYDGGWEMVLDRYSSSAIASSRSSSETS